MSIGRSMYDSILIPTDGSDRGAAAVEHGIELAAAFGATVHAIYVIETKAHYPFTSAGHDPTEVQEHRDYGEKTVEAVVEDAVDRGLDGVGVVKSGRVAQEIVEYAEDHTLDAIVIGAQGRSGLDRYLIGGTTEKVVRTADIPVITVRSDED